MIISDTHNFICMQPWKVASSTLYQRLKSFDSGKIKQGEHYNNVLGKIVHKHILLRDFLKLPESDNDKYKICFVKNIYDRVYSGFLQRQHRLTIDKSYTQSSEIYVQELKSINKGFESFVAFLFELYIKEGTIRGGFLHEYVYHDSVNMLDFVGYTERFEVDFAKVCDALGLGYIDQVNANVRSQLKSECDPHNMTYDDYKHIDKYTSKSVEIINECYSEDFMRFGYQKLDPNNFFVTLS